MIALSMNSMSLTTASLTSFFSTFDPYDFIIEIGQPWTFYFIDGFELLSNIMIFQWWEILFKIRWHLFSGIRGLSLPFNAVVRGREW